MIFNDTFQIPTIFTNACASIIGWKYFEKLPKHNGAAFSLESCAFNLYFSAALTIDTIIMQT